MPSPLVFFQVATSDPARTHAFLDAVFDWTTPDPNLPVAPGSFGVNPGGPADFEKTGDVHSFWTELVSSHDDEILLTWYEIGDPLLIHTQPGGERPYGVATVLVPALGARLTINGVQAKGRAWARDNNGRPFSTCALAFAEGWTEPRE